MVSKRDVIMNLMQMKDPDVSAVVRHPENAGLVATIMQEFQNFISQETMIELSN
jgi:hypothetical protein